ncbi:MAG TPA: hypothetical protein PKE45_25585, partial [Caldilineaceae bacterium]|nr:hypothetical protein [Caldilineaceae bacterium]
MIRPAQIGDIFTIQRLGRQATKLATIETLLNPQSAFRAALSAAILWNDAKVSTYLLQRREHGLASTGLLQMQKRPSRPEADILLLAPALDTTWGHPAIWQKLLAHAHIEAPQQGLTRLYADVPDQPLPVNTFIQTGFRVYTRQTIWRLSALAIESFAAQLSPSIRVQNKQDEWALQRLYARITPGAVQQAEGVHADQAVKPPLLEWWRGGIRKSFVLERGNEVHGCVQVAFGARGVWLQLWADTRSPDTSHLHELVRFGLTVIREDGVRLPVYVGVCEYESVLGSVLTDYGFAPFTDRAKLVKHVLQWVRSTAPLLTPVLDSVREVVPTPYVWPEEPRQRQILTQAKHG